MSDAKCIVPNCDSKATTGISLPQQEDLKKQWLESLEIPDFTPTPRSFVCIRHFDGQEYDVQEDSGHAYVERVLEELQIPAFSTNTVDSLQTSEEVTGNHQRSKKCRLCFEKSGDRHIFEDTERNIRITKILTYSVPQIRVMSNDGLSKWICSECLKTLMVIYDFCNKCITTQKKQKELLKQNRKRKANEDSNRVAKRLPIDELTSSKPIKSDIENKFNIVEAELMKALEENIPEEMKSAENIIIEVQSDEECDLKYSNDTLGTVLQLESDKLVIPKDVIVKVNSEKKEHSSRKVKGIFNSEFCEVENYLFEYRLCKDNIRQLRCIVPKCRAQGEEDLQDNRVWLKVPHNHSTPSSDEQKKQMFIHLMRRRMQSADKGLSFKTIYEEFCQESPEMKKLVPIKLVINQVCSQQLNVKQPSVLTFEELYELIENDEFQKLHFTYSHEQFYQEKFTASDGSKAIVFANCSTIQQISNSKLMYVDASFKLDSGGDLKCHIVTVLVWVADSYYPIMFALLNEKSQEIYKIFFSYLRDTLAPSLRPDEIVTDYEAALYYSLGEVYLDSHIGGSVFYYTQNLYKIICSLNLSRELETNSSFRNIYHMILMLPLLPVNTIADGLSNIELQANEMEQSHLTQPIFEYVKSQWMTKVTPELFCVHRLENRINENVIAPFKKLRDFLMLSKGKSSKYCLSVTSVVEKLIELEAFLSGVYAGPSKKSFARDLSSSQKKNVIKAWQFIESHPKININHFFTKVLGYIKCMENQLWIWGFYRCTGKVNDELIDAANFSIENTNNEYAQADYLTYECTDDEVIDVLVDQKNGFLVKEGDLQDEESADDLQTIYME